MIKLIGLVPLFPLIGFLINGFFGNKIGKRVSGIIASVSILASFILSVLIFVELNGSAEKSHIVNLFSWINSFYISYMNYSKKKYYMSYFHIIYLILKYFFVDF
jgi:NADH:ubiquinone oxidoreductase subunit 5 (subunit L)/multisubunit Na+/H+ antiporter MnhA subunit